ncbi:siderophore ABC transporter substrate-binding protein [Micrococcales bacterium 31B]|nr:siderophore ABC transporter substrate-binding protein [Micrococcales bacterium 31B]
MRRSSTGTPRLSSASQQFSEPAAKSFTTTSLSRRGALGAFGAAAAALALAACSSGDATTDAGATSGGAAANAGAGASGTYPVSITHKQGTAEIAAAPTKVITMDFSSLQTMNALGVEPIGLPKANVPKFLEKYSAETYLDAGTLQEPNYEKVNEATPDLIILSGRSAAAYPEASKIATTIDLSVDNAKYLESVQNNTTTLGTVFGKQAEAKALLDELQAKIDEVKPQAEAAGTGLIIMVNGGKVSAYGAGSRFAVVHDILGVKPADLDITEATHGDPVSFEYIKEKNPGMIFVVDRDSAVDGTQGAAQKVLDNALVKETDAAKNNKIVYIDAARWYLAGASVPDLTVMIDEVAQAF